MVAGEESHTRELDQTPTWAVALVVAVIIIISVILEKFLHIVGHTFQKRKKVALVEALEKIKGELMVLGFISLLLTFGQSYISRICIPERFANTMLPCKLKESDEVEPGSHHRRLMWHHERILMAGASAEACKRGFVPLISLNGLHQLHIFIFFLAIWHVFYSAITMMLGRLKIRGWKHWEKDIINNIETINDPSNFRLTHEVSFVKSHASAWMTTPVVFYIVCFFQHIIYSVQKADYLALRHGFVSVHLAPGSKFDFQKYIKRSLEDDFKVVVGIPPALWMTAVIYLLVDVHGWHAMFILSMMPLLIILAVGTKLQSIITRMAIEIQERHARSSFRQTLLVQQTYISSSSYPSYSLSDFDQNAFEITYFLWISYSFGFNSCFQDDIRLALLRVGLGLAVQFLCSYITLPLYALVTQMGSHMKRSIFDEHTSKALKNWHDKIKKKTDRAQPNSIQTLGGSPNATTFKPKIIVEMANKPSTPPKEKDYTRHSKNGDLLI